jgi:hypothetical protein
MMELPNDLAAGSSSVGRGWPPPPTNQSLEMLLGCALSTAPPTCTGEDAGLWWLRGEEEVGLRKMVDIGST